MHLNRLLLYTVRLAIVCVFITHLVGCMDICYDVFKGGCGNSSVILQSAPDPNTNTLIILLHEKPAYIPSSSVAGASSLPGTVTVQYFDPVTQQATNVTSFDHSFFRDMTIDTKRNHALIAKQNALISVDLTTGIETVVSDRTIGTGALYDPVYIVYDAIFDNVIAYTKDYNYQNLLYSIDLISGDRKLISKLDHDVNAISLDTSGRRLFMVYKPGFQQMGIMEYDLVKGGHTIVLDTANQIGDYSKILFPLQSTNISYSAKYNALFLLLTQRILSLDLSSGAVRPMGVDEILKLNHAKAFTEAYIVDDSLYFNVARAIDVLTVHNHPPASYLFHYDLISDKVENLELDRWMREDPILMSTANALYWSICYCF